MSQGDRRLAAIMFTDMVGFTALTQSSESQAMDVLATHNRLLRPFFPRFHGREVKAIGDSFLVEFDSALDAVRCAQEIQQYLHDYNSSTGDRWKIRLRIGIHLGDVIHQGTDVFGDAVNIASRLQPLADSEGICVSDQVFGQVRNKVEEDLVKMGPQQLKGINVPFDVYRVTMPWDPARGGESPALDTRRVAVLPFDNMSADPGDEFFADGLTEELIDRLCQVKGLEVIARTSVMSYKKKDTKAGEIGKELRAGALVEGSVRKAGNKIRVTAQLINANTEAHLWSSKYDRDLQDVFAVQTDIAEQVAGALQIHLVQSEKKAISQKPTEDLGAYTLYLRGRFLWNKRSTTMVKEALKLFQQAVEKDPGYARAYTGIADCYSILIDRQDMSWHDVGSRAREAGMMALELEPSLPEAHGSMGLVYSQAGEYELAEVEFKKAIDLNPGFAAAHQWLALLLSREGRVEEAVRAIAQAEGADPLSSIVLYNAGYFAWITGRDGEALEKWGRAVEINPNMGVTRWMRAGLYVNANRREEALEEIRQIEAAPIEGAAEARFAKAMLSLLYGSLGMKEEAELHLQALLSGETGRPISAAQLALAYAGLRNKDKFFEYATKAVEERSSAVSILRTSPLLEWTRKDPRYKAFLARVGASPGL